MTATSGRAKPEGTSPATDYAASGFFVLRTPLLPFDDFLRWTGGESADASAPAGGGSGAGPAVVTRTRGLRAMVEQPHVREALEVATPDLCRALDAWLASDAAIPDRLESSLIRYLARMTGRPTPFGLFAGWSVGALGDRTRLTLPPRASYRRHTRVDGGWLSSFLAALEKDPAIRRDLFYRPNECLYRIGGQWRYPETRMRSGQTPHFLVSVDDDEALRGTLERAAGGASLPRLAGALMERHEVSREEAESYLGELIDAQILVSDLRVLLTGGEALDETLRLLGEIPAAGGRAEALEAVRTELRALDEVPVGGGTPERHRALIERLRFIDSAEHVKGPLRSELHKPAADLSLGPEVVREILQGTDYLYRVFGRPSPDDELSEFREAFRERFGDDEVPLLEALDEEVGPGFGSRHAAAGPSSPLLAAVGLESPEEPGEQRWDREHGALLRELTEMLRAGRTEIQLDETQLLPTRARTLPAFPDAFVAVVVLGARDAAAVERGEFELVLRAISGPSGARMLGRFCSLDETMHQHVRAHLRAEEQRDPDPIHAELVHLPSPAMVHVMARPVLREFEIPLLARSGAPETRQIALADLTLTLVGDRFVLRCPKRGREVRVHQTSAHNFRGRGMSLYRFLCSLQEQGLQSVLSWNWGPLQSSTFLPRVRRGRLVLAQARWRFDPAEIRRLSRADGTLDRDALLRWRDRWRIPRHVGYMQNDQVLPVDFDHDASVTAFLGVVSQMPVTILREMHPGPDALCVKGPEGGFVHEIMVPFVRSRPSTIEVSSRREYEARPPAAPAEAPADWLYAKLYLAESSADRILRNVVRPLVSRVVSEGWSDRWFFIRYRDPGFHLRVRFHGDPGTLRDRVLPALFAAARPALDDGFLWRLTLDTYRPEYSRYEGPEGIALSEQVFHADSEASLDLVELTSGDLGAESRWSLAILTVDRMLDDLGFDLAAKATLLSDLTERSARRLNLGKPSRVRAADFFRTRQRWLSAMLEGSAVPEPLARAVPVLRKRSERIAAILGPAPDPGVLRLLRRHASDYVHLSHNRLHRCASLLQESILYDFLRRLYESRLARQR